MLKNVFDKITRGSLRFRWVTVVLSVILLVAYSLVESVLRRFRRS